MKDFLVSVPFRGFDVSNAADQLEVEPPHMMFPSPSGALMFLTQKPSANKNLCNVSVPFRGFDVSNTEQVSVDYFVGSLFPSPSGALMFLTGSTDNAIPDSKYSFRPLPGL